MDRISQLPDELLLRILSNLPCANNVMTTMVLSKRWQFLWMLVPKLIYDDTYKNIKRIRFIRFVDRSLLLHEGPVLETLQFKLGKTCGAEDIRVWIRAADKRCARELIIEIYNSSGTHTLVTLPRSLYKCCRMLVALKLSNAILVDVSSPISFPSLKKLRLISMKYPDDNFVNMLLSGCPVLEDLQVKLCPDDNVVILCVRVPHLKSLFVHKSREIDTTDDGLVIYAPSLECMKIINNSGGFCVVENNMPKIVKAHVDSSGQQFLLLKSITSAKRLNLCILTSKVICC